MQRAFNEGAAQRTDYAPVIEAAQGVVDAADGEAFDDYFAPKLEALENALVSAGLRVKS
jgi:hypothetical protein